VALRSRLGALAALTCISSDTLTRTPLQMRSSQARGQNERPKAGSSLARRAEPAADRKAGNHRQGAHGSAASDPGPIAACQHLTEIQHEVVTFVVITAVDRMFLSENCASAF
jgi:hypothetical protein